MPSDVKMIPVDIPLAGPNPEGAKVRPGPFDMPRTVKPSQGAGDPQELSQALKEINGFLQIVRRNLEFSIDDQTGRTVVTVIDADTNEIVRQIPPEDALRVARNLDDARGLLFRVEV